MSREPIQRKPGEALRILDELYGQDAEIQRELIDARQQAAVAQLIYDARIEAGLTQKELAKLVGTTQSVISQLERADYGGHSLTMLRRIGAALGLEVVVAFQKPEVPKGGRRRSARVA